MPEGSGVTNGRDERTGSNGSNAGHLLKLANAIPGKRVQEIKDLESEEANQQPHK